MTKVKVLLSILFSLYCLTGFTQNAEIKQKTVLIVLSSYGKAKGKIRPGFELDELSQAYDIFKNNGIKMTISSPKGGKVEPDKFNIDKPYNKKFMSDEQAMSLLNDTWSTALAQKSKFDAVYVVGGKGAMFDLSYDPSLQDLVQEMYGNGKIISSVCHGSAAFVNIKVNDSTFMVKGKDITGMCNEEETKFGKKWIKEFPYLLETKLKERGANYKSGAIMLPFVVVDGQFISGQNPFSTTLVAEEIVKKLGIKPVARQPYPDEKSMLLVKKALESNFDWAKNEIAKDTSSFDFELIAAYGYYGLLFADNNEQDITKSLSIIDLVKPYYLNEKLNLEIAKTLIKLNKKEEAKRVLKDLVEKNKLKEAALTLLNNLDK